MMPRDVFRFLVVIPHRNGFHVLERTLCHALAACGEDDRVLVVDNASSDGSAIAAVAAVPQVRLLRNSRNLGFAAACNQGGRYAESRYLLFLNSDALIPPNALDVLAGHLEANPQIGQLGLQLVAEDGTCQRSSMPQPDVLTELGFRRRVPRGYRDPVIAAPVGALVGACVCLPSEVFKLLGGWCEDFFFYEEDLDLSRRVISAGFEVVLLPTVSVVHSRGAATSSVRLPAQLESIKSRLAFVKKHFAPWSWLLVPARLLSAVLNASGAIAMLILTLGLKRGVRAKALRSSMTLVWLLSFMRLPWSLSDIGRAQHPIDSVEHRHD